MCEANPQLLPQCSLCLHEFSEKPGFFNIAHHRKQPLSFGIDDLNVLLILVIPHPSPPSKTPLLFIIHVQAVGGDDEKTESIFDLLLLGEAVVSLIVDLEVFVLSHHGSVDDLD